MHLRTCEELFSAFVTLLISNKRREKRREVTMKNESLDGRRLEVMESNHAYILFAQFIRDHRVARVSERKKVNKRERWG